MKSKILKTISSLGVFIISNIPIYFGVFLWWLLAPVGFWQQITFLLLSFMFFGGIQIGFWMFALPIILHIMIDSFETKKVIGR